PVAACALCFLARHEPRKIEELGRPLVGRIGALDVAELALPAEVAGLLEVGHRELLRSFGAARLDVAIHRREDRRGRAAVTDAHAAFVADLKDSFERELEIPRVPGPRVVGTLGGRLGGTARELGHDVFRGVRGAAMWSRREAKHCPPRARTTFFLSPT